MAELLDQYREKYPAYRDVDDETLANGIYTKFYADKMDRDAFNQKVGLIVIPKPPEPTPVSSADPQSPIHVSREALGIPTAAEEFRSVDNFVRSVADGASLGFADEIAAAGNSIFTDKTYDEALQSERARDDEIPTGQQISGNIVGALMTGGLGAANIARAPTVVGKIMRGAVVGGGYGAGTGFGTGEGVEDRLENATVFGPIGALTGGAATGVSQVIPPARDAIAKALQAGKSAVAPPRPVPNAPWTPEGAVVRGAEAAPQEDAINDARNHIAKALMRDGMTPDDIGYNLRMMGEGGTVADAGGASTQKLLDTVAQMPGRTRQALEDTIHTRQFGQGQRVTDAAAEALGVKGGFYQTLDDLDAAARSKAGPLYRQAYADNPAVVSDDIQAMLETPAGQQALRNAERMMRNERINPETMGVVVDAEGNVAFTEAPSLQVLDYVKRGFDDVLEKYRDKTTGRLVLDTEGRGVENLRRDYVAALDEATGGADSLYAAARAAYSGPASQKNAQAFGRGIFGQDAEVTAKRIQGMSDDERASFLDGVMRAIQDAVDRGSNTRNIVRALKDTPKRWKAIEAAFDDPRALARFESALLREDTFASTRAATAHGSQTFSRAAEAAEGGLAGSLIAGVGDLATGAPVQTGGRLAQKFFQMSTPETTRDAIGRILLSADPEEIAALTRTFNARQSAPYRNSRIAASLANPTTVTAPLLSQ
ncbi:MAG: hypothetical protein VX464_11630 [Pseudomonadota bacterium]|nr:hypothetical protein [Pseudomonadota bacterium]